MSKPIRVAIIGYGKIAEDQHVPSIATNPAFELAATVSRNNPGPKGVPGFTSLDAMLAATPGVTAVAICTPPSVRYEIARDCLSAGLHTLLEKPPGVSLAECEELARFAREKGVTLFTTWHSQYNPAVEEGARRLKGRRIARMHISWREDVRKWHPGQQWIWEPGGFGVFDPGINALSIATKIFPGALILRNAGLSFPENRQTPIAAALRFTSPAASGDVTAEFDWRYEHGEAWTIELATDDGETFLLSDGGARLSVNGKEVAAPGQGEYPAIYAHFADLLAAGQSHVDVAPLRLTADAFLLGRRSIVEPFED